MTIPVIAFLTMKGGVGKTTLAANITRALERRAIRCTWPAPLAAGCCFVGSAIDARCFDLGTHIRPSKGYRKHIRKRMARRQDLVKPAEGAAAKGNPSVATPLRWQPQRKPELWWRNSPEAALPGEALVHPAKATPAAPVFGTSERIADEKAPTARYAGRRASLPRPLGNTTSS